MEVSTHVGDVGDEAAMRKAAEGVRKWDVLVLNAGVLSPDPQLLGTVKVADWWGIFEVSQFFSSLLHFFVFGARRRKTFENNPHLFPSSSPPPPPLRLLPSQP